MRCLLILIIVFNASIVYSQGYKEELTIAHLEEDVKVHSQNLKSLLSKEETIQKRIDSTSSDRDSIQNQIQKIKSYYKELKTSFDAYQLILKKQESKADSVFSVLKRLKNIIKNGKRKYRKIAVQKMPKEEETYNTLMVNYETAASKVHQNNDELKYFLQKYRQLQNDMEREEFPRRIKKFNNLLAPIKSQIHGENERIDYLKQLVEQKREKLSKIKEYIYLVKESSYELYGKELEEKIQRLIEKKNDSIKVAQKYLLPKDTFEKTSGYKKRVEIGRNIEGVAALDFDSALSEIEKEYQKKEYETILKPIIEKSIKKNAIRNIKLDSYDADNETFDIQFDCCGKIDIVEKGSAPPKNAKIIFKNPSTLRGFVYSKYDKNCIEIVYFNGYLKHPYLKEPIKFAKQETENKSQ